MVLIRIYEVSLFTFETGALEEKSSPPLCHFALPFVIIHRFANSKLRRHIGYNNILFLWEYKGYYAFSSAAEHEHEHKHNTVKFFFILGPFIYEIDCTKIV